MPSAIVVGWWGVGQLTRAKEVGGVGAMQKRWDLENLLSN